MFFRLVSEEVVLEAESFAALRISADVRRLGDDVWVGAVDNADVGGIRSRRRCDRRLAPSAATSPHDAQSLTNLNQFEKIICSIII